MTYQSSTAVSEQKDASVPVLGETGGTIVYIYPSGNARVKKGKKSALINPDQGHSVSNQVSATQVHPSSPLQQDIATKSPSVLSSESNTRDNQKASSEIHKSVQPNRIQSSEQAPNSKQQLGDYLLKKRLVTQTQLEVAKYDLRTSGLSLEEILLARGWVSSEAIAQFQTM